MKWERPSWVSGLSLPELRGAKSGLTIGLPILGIVTSELLLYFGYTDYALWGHLLTLLFCTLAPLRFDSEITVFRAFALVPLFRLVNLGMPVFFEFTITWFPFVYGPLIPALVLIARDQRATESIRDRWPLRPSHALLFLPFAVFLSVVLAEIEYSILHPGALVPTLHWTNLLFIGIVMIAFVGFVEELLFRAILQQTLEERIGQWSGLVITSALFGLMHSGYGVPGEIAFAAGIGLVFGVLYDYTDSLVLVTLIHGLLNVFLFAVIPLRGSILPI